MPTTRPSDFPEPDFWPASMRVCPGTEPAVLGITYEMAILQQLSGLRAVEHVITREVRIASDPTR